MSIRAPSNGRTEPLTTSDAISHALDRAACKSLHIGGWLTSRSRRAKSFVNLPIANCCLACPAQQRGSHGESRAYGRNQDEVALLQSSLLPCRFQCQWDGPCRSVAKFADIDNDAIFLQAQSLRGRHNDPPICLVRNKQFHVVAGESITLQQPVRSFRHFADGILKDLRTILVNKMHFLVHRFMRRGMQASASGHVEIASAGSIHFMREVD